MNLVTSVGEVVETLFPPRVTMVPGTRSWLKGVANVRGTLLPIIDLAGFLTGLDGGAGKRARVLVINQAPVVVGLLVEEVVGLRHFFREERVDLSDEVLAAVRPYASVSYRDGSSAWTVFDMGRLVRNPQFLQVSA
jgi:twitching motility protein PilI